MTPKLYKELALRTEPTEEQYLEIQERLKNTEMLKSLEQCMHFFSVSSDILDIFKKHIFYGKPFNKEDLYGKVNKLYHPQVDNTLLSKDFDLKTTRLFHAVLGLATEAGELTDALKKNPIDYVNIKEEFGDQSWYNNLGLDVCETTLEEVMKTNIDKLAKRYGDKFSDEKALNRNLDEERKILENGQ